jgi:hypothetical protein
MLSFPRNILRCRQLSIGGVLVGIALLALLMNWLRPISETEAARIAERRFRSIPGASEWIGRFQARPRRGDEYWFVNIVELGTDKPLVQVSLDRRGHLESTVVALPGHIAPIPAEMMTSALPPPDQWKDDPNGPQSVMVVPPPNPGSAADPAR